MATKPLIRRNFGRIVSETPYDTGWIGAIKYVIPSRERNFASHGVWDFDPRWYAAVVAITKHYFGNNYLDSTGGVAEPQSSAWIEKFAVWIDRDEALYGKQKAPPPREAPTAFDAHAVLFVTKDAPAEVIKAAHRVLSAKHHPDKGGDEELMKRINAAYQVLQKRGLVQ